MRAMMRTRGELAKHCDVNPETIRFYERSGLLPATKRTASRLPAVRRHGGSAPPVH